MNKHHFSTAEDPSGQYDGEANKAIVNSGRTRLVAKPRLRVCFINKELYEAFTRKYSLPMIADYGKLRECASIHDVAFQFAIMSALNRFGEDNYALNPWSYSMDGPANIYDDSGFAPLTQAQTHEVQYSVHPIGYAQSTLEAAQAYLNGQTEDECESSDVVEVIGSIEDTTPYYRTFLAAGVLYIVVREGFLKHLKSTEATLAFYRQVLKTLLTIHEVADVNDSVWYRGYTATLSAM